MEKTSIKDMTVGSPLKHIIRFSIPMLIGNLFQQFYNMVDSIVVGKFVGKDALAAVGSTASLIFLISGLTFGLSGGISIVIAQYFGAKDYEKVKKSFATATYMVMILALIMSIVGILSSRFLLELINTPATIIDQADIYMKITFAGTMGVAVFFGMSGVLRALGDSTTPLKFLIIASIINVILDLLFVIAFHWDVVGVAVATIIAQFISGISCTIYALKKVKILRVPLKEFKPDLEILKKCLKLGIPVALQNVLISVSLVAMQGVVNRFDEVVIAAQTVVARIEQLVLQPFMSVGAALASYAGQNMGAGRSDRAKKGFYSASLIIVAFSLLMLPIMYFGGEYIMRLFTKKEDVEVVITGVKAIRITCFFYSAVGMIFISRNFLSGTGDMNITMVMGAIEVVCRVVLASVMVNFVSFYGIWWATGLTWLIAGLVGIGRYMSGKWKTKAIVNN